MYELRNMLVSWINLHLPSMHFNDTLFVLAKLIFQKALEKSEQSTDNQVIYIHNINTQGHQAET